MQDIILKPILSEKSLLGTTVAKYAFKVHKSANKPMIAKALKEIFKVEAVKINIINLHGESKSRRGRMSKDKDVKKAVVTLKKGQKIEGFEFKD
jgi:large subunit ribosomal protein L23